MRHTETFFRLKEKKRISTQIEASFNLFYTPIHTYLSKQVLKEQGHHIPKTQ